MKTIILMRHSIPEKANVSTEFIPLSSDGVELALSKKEKLHKYPINKCFSSPYLRAKETAQLLFNEFEIIDDLHERVIGEAKEDFWYKQYSDYDYKNNGGESLNEVKVRMKKAMDHILGCMDDHETALVVSHGTAICAYLLNFCDLKVIDPNQKTRKIYFNDQVIVNGKINPTDYFMIQYDDEVVSISFMGENDKEIL